MQMPNAFEVSIKYRSSPLIQKYLVKSGDQNIDLWLVFLYSEMKKKITQQK